MPHQLHSGLDWMRQGAYARVTGPGVQRELTVAGEGLVTTIIGPNASNGGVVAMEIEVDGSVVASGSFGAMVRPIWGSCLSYDASDAIAVQSDENNGYGDMVYVVRLVSPWYAVMHGAPCLRFRESFKNPGNSIKLRDISRVQFRGIDPEH